MAKTVMQRVGETPFVSLIFTLLLIATYLGEVVFGLACAFRILEIPSVVDRWLPGYTALDLLGLLATVIAVQWVVVRVMSAMQSPTSSLNT